MNVISVVAGVRAVAPARGNPCRSRLCWTVWVVLLVLGFVLASPAPSRADIGVIVLEPIGALGFFTRVGHAGTYFSNICQDGSPVRVRLCVPGESGGVVSKYAPLSEHEDYDWAIVPFEEYMHGLELVEAVAAEYGDLPTPRRDPKGKAGRGEPRGGLNGALAGTGHGIPDHGSGPE